MAKAEKIQIGATMLTAKVSHSGKTLSLTFEKMGIDEIAALLNEDNAPEIRVLDSAGAVKAIYRNHALVKVVAETIGGVRTVCAVMQTDEMEKTQADELTEKVDMLTECLLEISEMVYV